MWKDYPKFGIRVLFGVVFELSFIQNGMISRFRFPCSNDFASMETIITLNVCEILNQEDFRLLSFLSFTVVINCTKGNTMSVVGSLVKGQALRFHIQLP